VRAVKSFDWKNLVVLGVGFLGNGSASGTCPKKNPPGTEQRNGFLYNLAGQICCLHYAREGVF